jgi:hypothetical protein
VEWELEKVWRYQWHVVIKANSALLTVGVLIVNVGVDLIESSPSKTSMSDSTWLTWSIKSVLPARRLGHACVRKGGWARTTDTHALHCDVTQNLMSSMTWQICVGGVVGEQLEWDVIEIQWSTGER